MDDHHKFTAHFIVLPGKLCLQATLFTFMSGRRRKILPSSKGEREKRMGSKNNGAHTERLVPYLLPCLEQAIPQLPRCVFFFLLIPLPLLLLLFFLPSSVVFLREQQGLVALATLHSSTSLRLQIIHFRCRC